MLYVHKDNLRIRICCPQTGRRNPPVADTLPSVVGDSLERHRQGVLTLKAVHVRTVDDVNEKDESLSCRETLEELVRVSHLVEELDKDHQTRPAEDLAISV